MKTVQKVHTGIPSSSALVRSVILGCVMAGMIAWLSALVFIAHQLSPQFTNGVYSVDGGPRKPFSFPLIFDSVGQSIVIDFDVVSPWKYQPDFLIASDDCMTKIQINGMEAAPDRMELPYCVSDLQKFHFQPFMTTAISHFTVTLEDHGGLAIFDMRTAKYDALITLLCLFGIAGIIASLWFSSRLLPWKPADTAAAGIVAFGVFLRLLYVTVTSYNVRSHEWDKHVDYVRYVSQHFSVPPAAGGWEFHQPPLYYFFTGAWMKLATVLQRSPEVILHDLQIFSLLVSIATLLTGTALAYVLFKGDVKKHQRLLFIALVAVFPTLVMFSSRITNDVLLQFLSFLFVFFLLCFWQHRRLSDVWRQILVIILAILTKLSGYVLLPVSLLCIVLLRGVTRSTKIAWISLVIIISLGATMWLPILRLAVETDRTRSLFFASEGLDPQITLMNMPRNFLTFNPLEILRHPFNNPYLDTERRQFFPEYFYKSAFFGEFDFGPSFLRLSFLILSLGFVSIFLVFFGVFHVLQAKLYEFFPLLCLLTFHLLAAVAYRFLSSYSPAQDFRFVTVLTIPWFAFAITGAFALPPFLRRLCISILWAWVAVCVLLFLKIFFDSSL